QPLPKRALSFGPPWTRYLCCHVGTVELWGGFVDGDFNGDGRLDIVYLTFQDPHFIDSEWVKLVAGKADGTFAFAPGGGSFMERRPPVQVVSGHFRGNGRRDVLVALTAGTALLMNDGAGTLGAPLVVDGAAGTELPVGDSDGDGRDDLTRTAGT